MISKKHKKNSTSVIEIWDEDCGWKYYCGNCGRHIYGKPHVNDNCLYCNKKIVKIERI